MSRGLDSSLLAELPKPVLSPALLVKLTFRSGTEYVWTGPGPLEWDGNTYQGVGSLGSIGTISEGTDVEAAGTSVTLSGIDPALLAASLEDVKSGGDARLWLSFFDSNGNLQAPYQMFRGVVDQPTVSLDDKTLSITLTLESPMINLQRPNNRRYTTADQAIDYPDDSAFDSVEKLNDATFKWGTA